jgi:hypothetical protein
MQFATLPSKSWVHSPSDAHQPQQHRPEMTSNQDVGPETSRKLRIRDKANLPFS